VNVQIRRQMLRGHSRMEPESIPPLRHARHLAHPDTSCRDRALGEAITLEASSADIENPSAENR
jgi:hypothetical protein